MWKRSDTSSTVTASQVVLVVVLVVIAGVFFHAHTRGGAIADAARAARYAAARNLALQTFFDREIEPRFVRSADAPAPTPDVTHPWLAPNWAARTLDRYTAGLLGDDAVLVRELAVGARSPDHEATGEAAAWFEAARRDPAVTEVTLLDPGPPASLVYRRRGRVYDADCLACHGDPEAAPDDVRERWGSRGFGHAAGDLASIVEARVPLAGPLAAARRDALVATTLVAVLLSIALGLQNLLIRHRIVGPIQRLTRAARSLGRDRHPSPVPLPPARDLRELTQAFNAMEARLARSRAELEEAVAARTAELESARDALREREARRRRDLAELLERQRLESLGRMAGGFAHEFNNRLSAILGNVVLALEELPAGHPVREELEDAAQAARDGAELTARLLAYARGGPTRPEPLDPVAFLAEREPLLRAALGSGVALEVTADPDLPRVLADPAGLEQALVHLVTNAAEALADRPAEPPAPAVVRLAARRATDAGEDAVAITVADEGPGMEPEVLARIFDPFFTTREHGRGLGLSATEGLVRGMGGRVTVDSAPGRGTRVTLLLPAARGEVPDEAVPREAAAEPPAPATSTSRVLVVDDEAPIRRLAIRALSRDGFQVEEAASGEEALARIAEDGPPALVLLDLSMPGLDGPAVLARLRERWPGLPVILTSGYHGAADDGALRGVPWLPKPYDGATLRAAVRQALGR